MKGAFSMQTDLTEIAYILDRSGSMSPLVEDAIGGFNTFLANQKALPGRANFSLVLFDHEYVPAYDGVDIQSVPPLTRMTYAPRGTTALLDAVGRTIDQVGARLAATPEAERPSKVIIAIFTDGLENASTDYRPDRIAAMIRHQQEVYAWEFLFLAANQDAIATARAFSIPAAHAFNVVATGEGVRNAQAHLHEEVRLRRQR
jgi:hypothetical protein